MSHGKRVYSCGCLAYQCRCFEGCENVVTLPYPCHRHTVNPAFSLGGTPPAPPAWSRPSEDFIAFGTAVDRDRERLIDEARD